MRIATRFSIAVHVLSLLGADLSPEPTSEWIAGSVGVNPVVVRNITSLLRKAGLVYSNQGKAGTHLAKPLDQITLLDVYRAVEVDQKLFAMHPHPHPECPVGKRIEGTLMDVFGDAQRAMEDRLAAVTLQRVVESLLVVSP